MASKIVPLDEEIGFKLYEFLRLVRKKYNNHSFEEVLDLLQKIIDGFSYFEYDQYERDDFTNISLEYAEFINVVLDKPDNKILYFYSYIDYEINVIFIFDDLESNIDKNLNLDKIKRLIQLL